MPVIYQIHDFCANNFHYHNAVDGDYRWCSHYRTLATACEEVAATVDHNSNADSDQIDGDCNAMSRPIRWSYSDDDSADGIVAAAAAGWPVDSRSHSVSAVKRAPVTNDNKKSIEAVA
jgi:hypothetical protein